jgi:hypothetical protein
MPTSTASVTNSARTTSIEASFEPRWLFSRELGILARKSLDQCGRILKNTATHTSK